jgi:hypothetical protein
MSGEDILKRSVDCKPEGRRKIERPKLRGIDGVFEDIKKMKVKNWWIVARDRKAWREVLRKAETHIWL